MTNDYAVVLNSILILLYQSQKMKINVNDKKYIELIPH